jgi:hypothetical protein
VLRPRVGRAAGSDQGVARVEGGLGECGAGLTRFLIPQKEKS